MSRITCDKCGKEFDLSPADIRNRQSGELVFRYFCCPECGAAYMISATTKKFRTLVNKGKTPRETLRILQDALNQQFFHRFKELIPNAYEPEKEAEDEQS